MIIFDKLTYKNFLSSGNQEVEVDFKKFKSTLMVGDNGAGKSTFIDALCFCMFGKAFRKVKKGQLNNTINVKEMLTTLTLTIGTKSYKIIRGSRPNIFEVWIDDEMLNQDASSRDYQSILEDKILKLNYKSFTQIVVLGSSSYIPFMQLPLASRREIIENLLDITVFTDMNKLLKAKLKALESDLNVIQNAYDLAKQEHDMKTEFKNKASDELGEQKTKYDEQIVFYKSEIDRISILVETAKKAYDELDYKKIQSAYNNAKTELEVTTTKLQSSKKWIAMQGSTVDRINDGITKAESTLKTFQKDIKHYTDNLETVQGYYDTLKDRTEDIKSFEDEAKEIEKGIHGCKLIISQKQKDIDFYHNNDVCNTCHRPIGDDIRDETIAYMEDAVKVQNDEMATYQTNLDANVLELADAEQDMVVRRETEKKISDLKEKIDHISGNVKTVEQAMIVLQQEMIDTNETTKQHKSKAKEYEDRIKQLQSVDFESIYQIKTKQYHELLKEFNAVTSQYTEVELHHESAVQNLERVEQEITKNEEYAVQIKKLSDELLKLETDRKEKEVKVEYHRTVGVMLKDDGIKTRIIKHYLPVINKTINDYLEQFNFPVSFFFDESFNEQIKSRFRDKLGYNSFSEGEKARIDLALMFTWRTIAMAKNRTATNILVFDEVFDSSMDGDGSDSFMNIIEDVQKTSNVVVISHKEEMTTNKGFERVLQAYKNGNFSYLRDYNG